MKQHIKQLNETFNAKQQLIEKDFAKVYSDAVNIVASENLNSIAYMDVMIKIMDEIIRYQKKKLPAEEIFGGDAEGYAKKLCADRPKKKAVETIFEALGVVGWVFFAGFFAGSLLIGKDMLLSVLALVRWGILLIVGLVTMIYLQKKRMRSQIKMMFFIMLAYMGASSTVDVLFKGLEEVTVSVNTYILAAFFALVGFGATKLKNNIKIEEYKKWRDKK